MSLTLQQFKDKYLGKQVEYHSYGSGSYAQCVDLVNAYINQCLDTQTKDYTEIIGTNAKDFVTKYDPEDFEYIKNTPTGVPQQGDIPIWNGNVGGGVGHVAIVLEANVNSFKSLDQNWSQKERVTLETHDYKNVLGWLRPKNTPVIGGDTVTIPAKELDELRRLRDTRYNFIQTVCEVMGVEYDENLDNLLVKFKNTFAGIKSTTTNAENKLTEQEGKLREALENAKNYEKQLAYKDTDCQQQVQLKINEINRLNEIIKSNETTKLDLEGRVRVLEGQKEELIKKHTKLKAELAKGIPRGFIKKIRFIFSL